MRINLTLRQVSIFLELARTGSFSEAARLQGISQPALTRTIQQMEEVVGRRLFDRSTRSVALTPTGRQLRPIAERLVAEFDGAFGELGRFIEGRCGRIVVAALPSVAAVLLPPAIAQYQKRYPDVEVTIMDDLSASVLDAVSEGHADIGLTIRPNPHATLAYQPLLSDEFGLVCRSDDELADESALPWSVFEGRPFVAMASGSSVRQTTDAVFLQAGMTIPPLYGCTFLNTAGRLVAAGLGITALPRLTMILLGQPDLHWRRLERPVMRRHVGVVTRIGRTPAPAAQAFLTELEQQARLHG